MKKLLLLIIPIVLTIGMMACDFTSEDELSKTAESSSGVSDATGAEEADSSVTDESSEAAVSADGSSDTSAEESQEESKDPNEIIEKTIEGVIVAVKGESELEDNGYEIASDFDMTVSVTVKGARSIIEDLQSAGISANINVADIAESGEVELIIDFVAPEGAEIIATSSNFATVSIEKVSGETTPPVQNTGAYIADNGIVISGDRGMEQFGGSAAAGQKTAEKLNEFKTAVGANVNVYILPAPIASAFYAPEEYPSSIQKHIDCFNGLKDALVDVKYVDALNALSAHSSEEIFFRTDHHWQALGAYYAAEQLAKVAGTSFDSLSTFTIQSADGVVGSLYGYSNDPVLKNNPDTMVWYVPTREHSVTYYSVDDCDGPITGKTLFSSNNGYTKFIHGDSYTTHIVSNVGNGRKLLVFKDSFGNALAPFLVGSFDEVYIADYREFELNAKDFIEEKGITDVCFAMAAFSVAGSKRDHITRVINN